MTEIPQKPTVSRGTYHLFAGNLVSTIVLAITSILVGRLLGPDEFGLYTIVLIVPAYAYLALNLGVTSTITHYSAKYLSEGNEKKAISFSYTISILHFAVGLMVVTVLIPFTGLISKELLHRPALGSGLIIPVALFGVVGQILFFNGIGTFVGIQSFEKSAIFQIISAFAKLVFSVLLILIGYSLLGATIGFTFGFLVAGVISMVFLISMNRSAIPRNIRQDFAVGANYAWPIFLSLLANGIVLPIQNTILAYTVSNTEIGWYSAAVNITTLILLFTYPITTVLLPLFSKTVTEGSKELATMYKLSLKYTALSVTPVTVLLIVLATPITTAIYGQAYQFAGNYLQALALIYLLSGLGYLSWNQFLYGVAETRKALLATGTGSLVSVVLSMILIFSLGVYGIIIGTILGSAISLSMGSRFVSRVLGTKLQPWFAWRIYLSSALAAIIVYPTSLLVSNPYIVIVIGAVVFFLVLIPIMTLTNALTKGDLSELQEQFKEVKLIKKLLSLVYRYQNLFYRLKEKIPAKDVTV